MKALTLHQPWVYAITDLGKRVENRTWKPPANIVGKRIALHAGKSYDQAGHVWIEQTFGVTIPAGLPSGAIVATVLVVGCNKYHQSPWFFGPIGWILDDVRKLAHPVPCRGFQGVWQVPVDVLRRMEK